MRLAVLRKKEIKQVNKPGKPKEKVFFQS